MKRKYKVTVHYFDSKTKAVHTTVVWKTKPITKVRLGELVKRDLLSDKRSLCFHVVSI